jgi:hypothetical protein
MTSEKIAQQLALINIHRRSVRVYVKQLAAMQFNVPPHVIDGLEQGRAEIARIKTILTSANVDIDDEATDTPSDWEYEFGVR